MQQEKQNIELTKEQFLLLMKVVYLGNWMANASRTGRKDDPHIKEYEEISDFIFSLASKFGFSENIEHELEFDESVETTEVSKLREDYDEETFWAELPDRLGERDFYNMYSKEDWKRMTQDERFLKMQECVIKWEEELEKYGIDRLEMVDRQNLS